MKNTYAVAPITKTPDQPLPTVTTTTASTDWIIRVGRVFHANGGPTTTTPSSEDAAGFPNRVFAEGVARGITFPMGDKFVEPRRLDRSLLVVMSIAEQRFALDRNPAPSMQVLLDAGYAVRSLKGFAITDAGKDYLRRTRSSQRYTRTTRLPTGDRVETLTVVALDGSDDIAVEVTFGTPDKPGPLVGLYTVDGERIDRNATWAPVLGDKVFAGPAATHADVVLRASRPGGTTFLDRFDALPFSAIFDGWSNSAVTVTPWKGGA